MMVCNVVNEVVNNSDISTIALLYRNNSFSNKAIGDISDCLIRNVTRFIKKIDDVPNYTWLPDTTIFILITDNIDWVRDFFL